MNDRTTACLPSKISRRVDISSRTIESGETELTLMTFSTALELAVSVTGSGIDQEPKPSRLTGRTPGSASHSFSRISRDVTGSSLVAVWQVTWPGVS